MTSLDIDTFTFGLKNALDVYPKTEVRPLTEAEAAEWKILGNSVEGGFGIPLKGYDLDTKGMVSGTLSFKGFWNDNLGSDMLKKVNEVRNLCTPVIERLDALPTPKDVAHFLRDERIVGIPGNSEDCPMANYLSAMTQHKIGVHTECISFQQEFKKTIVGKHNSSIVETTYALVQIAQLSHKLQRFVNRFDAGKYKYLQR